MGRRKIEIKAIKDDRNRSVTFLKRKGGLFKKAHELSVLCSVDVAVIIFGQNKKLYEFSSGDIRETLQRYTFYAGPHEHKGPSDFAGKGDGDDDDEDDDNMGSPPPEQPSPPHHGVPPHFQPHLNQPHMRSHTQSASPPMNGHAFHPPPQNVSRPASRTHSRRASSNLVPPNQRQPHAAQPPSHPGANHINYSYPPNASYYQNPTAQNMHVNHHQQQQQQQQQQNLHVQGHPPHFQQSHGPPPPHSQLQQMYLQEQRRHSMSPSFPIQAHHERMHQNPVVQTPPHIQRPFQSPPLPEPKGMPKSESVDSGRTNAGQGWQQQETPRSETSAKAEHGIRSQSIDMGSALRNSTNGASPQQSFAQPNQPPARAESVSGGSDFATPSRMNSMQSDAKRPRLKVQIPSEQSENGSATGESSGKDGDRTSGATPVKASTSESTHSSGVVLPPPSPSASAILSAGATGPTNPFARPPPKSTGANQGPAASLRDNETPISALPSRYLNDTFLASPSNLFPDWNFGAMNHNSLASPATYQPSPIRPERPTFKDDLPEKRKVPDEEPEGTPNKKPKS